MSDWRRLTWRHGRIVWSPLRGFWQPPVTLDFASPKIPNLPIKSPAAGGDHTISPLGFENTSAFGIPALNATIAPTGHANVSAFGVPSINATIAPAGFANISAFGVPALHSTVAPSGFANVSVFGVPSLNATIAPAGFENVSEFGQPTIEPVVAAPVLDGSGLRVTRKRRQRPAVRPRDFYRTPEDIQREQLETERYLASLEKPQQVSAPERRPEPKARPATGHAAQPILADVAARAASAVQAKLEEAESAAALGLLAEQQQRRRKLVLLLALD